MFIALSFIVMIVGLLIYVLTTPPAHPKASVVGLVMFAAGLLAFLLQFGGWTMNDNAINMVLLFSIRKAPRIRLWWCR